MNTLDNLVNRLSLFNSGYDIRNRSMPLKLVVVVGMIAAIVLAVMGAIIIING